MPHKTDISILIVTHNHGDYIAKLLNDLHRFGYTNVYICDAKSQDQTVNLLKESPYSKQILIKDKLEGFSKNNNDLIRFFKLNTPYYLLLNPDVYLEEDFLAVLYSEMNTHSSIGIIAPMVKYPNGSVQTTWKKFPSVLQVFKKRLGLAKAIDEKQQKSGVIDWCLGACMLIRSSFLKKNGNLLDERYRLYCEDVDICFEAKMCGFQVIGSDKTFVYHHLNELSAKNIFSKYNWWNIVSIFKFALKWNYKFICKK
ncbi:MAG TPA: glycosyltransferase family 2 protein [Crocinitomicaceae bacterium]|nr:glycosyltransferase family 2 protein [Crocinitomicaceae bacterium]